MSLTPKQPDITIKLTQAQALKLREVLNNHCDMGRPDEGYKSDELMSLAVLVDAAIRSGLK